ncbi:UPF0481 protein At3g47200 [Eucalyptus grandis]|nr:UPF0481 protein At3g47200 [Eucalyptus grandis]
MAGAGTSESDCHLDEVEFSIKRKLEGLSPLSDCCIFTVPERLRQTNEKAYTPCIVAIGPYHHLNSSLMPMENHKLLYLQNFLLYNQNYRLKEYIQRVKSWENDARNSYDKKINLDSNKFAEMILLDGIFVIQLFLMKQNNGFRLPNDQIFGKPWMLTDIRSDMALLENQMPFFIVQKLFYMAFGPHHSPTLLQLVWSFFELTTEMGHLPWWVVESEVKHFLDVIRLSFLPSVRMTPNESQVKTEFTQSATELVKAGVKLRRGKSNCLFDIEFKNGVLNIPELKLFDITESYFRNIIAFEQCYHYNDRYLIDYLAFMDSLVDTQYDAKLLIEERIINNWLSNKKAVADLINSLCEKVTLSKPGYYFNNLSIDLNNHCKKSCNKWKATFKHEYCSNPWAVISVIAAVVLLLLTAAQTVCSVISL